MKIECSKNRLREIVSKAEKITGKNATLPVLSCVILEAKNSKLIIQATNLELGIEIITPVKVFKEGIVAVPGSLLISYISSLSHDGPITLETIDGTLLMTNQTNETKIKTLNPEDFPAIAHLSSEKKFKLSAKDLVVGLKSVWYAASVSSMKPELSSVYIYPEGNHIVFVATDSFRLAEKKVRVEGGVEFENILVPFKNVSELIRVLEGAETHVEVTFDNNQVSFEFDGTYVLSRIVDGTFPDYKQIIPKSKNTDVVVLKQDLLQALKVSNIFSDNFNKVTFMVKPSDGVFEIFSKNIDKGENRNMVQGTLEGDDVTINFNQKYIVDCFNSLDSDSLALSFDGVSKPMVIRGVRDGSFMYLVMPMNK